jgi:hypothetical protein
MTTIACSRTKGVMACDSLWTVGVLRAVNRTKVRRLPSGALLGTAGENDGRAFEALLAEVKRPSDLPMPGVFNRLRQEISGLILFPELRLFHINTVLPNDTDDESGVTEITEPFWAIGSGGELALGALAAGASPERAVKIGIQFDPNSGGKVHSLKVR